MIISTSCICLILLTRAEYSPSSKSEADNHFPFNTLLQQTVNQTICFSFLICLYPIEQHKSTAKSIVSHISLFLPDISDSMNCLNPFWFRYIILYLCTKSADIHRHRIVIYILSITIPYFLQNLLFRKDMVLILNQIH